MSDSAASVKRTLDASESIEHKRSRPEESLVATTVATELSGLTREINAGIVAYIKKDAPGFSAIIKHRTYDFMVFEIDNEDQPVHLTSMALPDTKKTSKTTTESELLDDKEKEKEPVDVYKQLGAYIGIEASEQLRSMVESKGKEPTEVLAPAVEDKAARATAHQLIREHLGKDAVSDTIDGYIRIRSLFNVKAKDIRGGIRGRGRDSDLPVSWDDMPGLYCQFLLYKEGKDTMDAIEHISRVTRLNSRTFSYAGTKDRQAVTVQRVTAHKVTADRLLQVNQNRAPVRVGNFSYVKAPLRLGDLGGNRFVIVLRDVKGCSEEDLVASLVSLRDYGFINYYGTQRFGTGTVSTQKIGACMLRADWESAVTLLLTPDTVIGQENSRHAQAREHWKEHGDPAAAAKLFPNHCVAERAILNYFSRKEGNCNDYYGAVMAMPINMRKLYAHSYQSYVWNCAATERIKRYGLKPVIGDLAVEADCTNDEEELAGNEETLADKADEDTNHGDRIQSVVTITAENIHLYTTKDIVLPLPGHRIEYPSNEIGQFITTLMEKDGLDPLNMERKVDFISLPGSYRRVFAIPRDLRWELLRYDDPTAPLTLSDLDKLQNKPNIHSDTGKYLAIRLALTLTAGQYATMALRELMRQDTSPAFQFNLSKLHAQEQQQQQQQQSITVTEEIDETNKE